MTWWGLLPLRSHIKWLNQHRAAGGLGSAMLTEDGFYQNTEDDQDMDEENAP